MRTIPDTEPTKRCAAAHITQWMVDPQWFTEAVRAYQHDRFPIEAAHDGDGDRVLYQVDVAGIAHIPMMGHMMKIDSKFGGTNTLRTRHAVRTAATDTDVKAILLSIDSPGGTVAGTEELARDVANANAVKPVFAHIDDLGASAAMWVASQAGHISANATALVGSIGVVAVLEDSSKAAEKEGITVHVISTGKFKGAGIQGTKITDEHLAEIQEMVDDLNGHFLAAVSDGRQMPMDAVEAIADGRIHIAAKALDMGLIDAVQSGDETVEMIRADIAQRESKLRAANEKVNRRVAGFTV